MWCLSHMTMTHQIRSFLFLAVFFHGLVGAKMKKIGKEHNRIYQRTTSWGETFLLPAREVGSRIRQLRPGGSGQVQKKNYMWKSSSSVLGSARLLKWISVISQSVTVQETQVEHTGVPLYCSCPGQSLWQETSRSFE